MNVYHFVWIYFVTFKYAWCSLLFILVTHSKNTGDTRQIKIFKPSHKKLKKLENKETKDYNKHSVLYFFCNTDYNKYSVLYFCFRHVQNFYFCKYFILKFFSHVLYFMCYVFKVLLCVLWLITILCFIFCYIEYTVSFYDTEHLVLLCKHYLLYKKFKYYIKYRI